MPHAVVVGGGVSGLAAARDLLRDGWSVSVLEASRRWGGKVAALELDGVRLDCGAESVLARRPEAVRLIGELGLGDALVHPTGAEPAVLVGGRLAPLPPSVLGVPTDLDALEGLLSPVGLERARREPDLPAPGWAGDVAVGRLVDDRFGPEVTDRLVEPLLGGVYAGRARELSFAATSPALFARARIGGSVLAAARAQARPAAGTPVFAGLSGGVSGLVDALVAELEARGAVLRSGVTVTELGGTAGGYCLSTEGPGTGGAMGSSVHAEAVVVATPASAAGRLLADLVSAAGEWASWSYASVAVVTLVVAGLQPGPSGLLVPPGELPSIKALTYSSTKWDWVRAAAQERWGPGTTVVRASVGRLGEEHLLQLGDRDLVARTFGEAAGLPGWEAARLGAAAVTRWGGSLPQYAVGHVERVTAVRDALTGHPGLAVCGAALDGVGVASCLASATLAVGKIGRDFGEPAGQGRERG